MQFLRNLSIQKKLTFFFGIACALTVGIGLLCLVMLSKVSQATVEINNKWLPGVRILDAMHSQHSIMQRATLSDVMCADAECRASNEARYQAAKLKLGEGFQQFQKLTTGAQEKDLLTYLDGLVGAYNDASAKSMALAASGASQTAIADSIQQSRATYEAAYKVGDDVVAMYNKGAGDTTEQVISTAATARVLVSIACVMVLVVCVFATMLLTSLISARILKSVAAVERLAAKDMTVSLEVTGTDETGRLEEAISTCASSVRTVLQSVAEAADMLSAATTEISAVSRQCPCTIEQDQSDCGRCPGNDGNDRRNQSQRRKRGELQPRVGGERQPRRKSDASRGGDDGEDCVGEQLSLGQDDLVGAPFRRNWQGRERDSGDQRANQLAGAECGDRSSSRR
jgi:methyl-accepting chemotaxis protein